MLYKHMHMSALLLHKMKIKMCEKWHDWLFKFKDEITETKLVHVDESRNSLLKTRKKTRQKIGCSYTELRLEQGQCDTDSLLLCEYFSSLTSSYQTFFFHRKKEQS